MMSTEELGPDEHMMTAEELGIPDEYRRALILTLILLESKTVRSLDIDAYVSNKGTVVTGSELRANTVLFSMQFWKATLVSRRSTECGTVCCVGGLAELLGGVDFLNFVARGEARDAIDDLFYPDMTVVGSYASITTKQAARALRNYLETGYADWRGTVR